MRQLISQTIQWLGGHELVVLLGLFAVVVGSWTFIVLADEMMDGDTQAVDERILLAMRHPEDRSKPIGPDWMAELGRDATALGGYGVLVLVTMGVVVFLLLDRKYTVMWFMLGSVISGYLLTMGLKTVFHRGRPDLVSHLSQVDTTSFPSGHAMMSAVVYLTLGALLARMVKSKRLKFYFLAVAVMLSSLVGVSRVYMGVHYPSDVLAGWAGGLVWSTVCLLVVRRLQRRGLIEFDL